MTASSPPQSESSAEIVPEASPSLLDSSDEQEKNIENLKLRLLIKHLRKSRVITLGVVFIISCLISAGLIEIFLRCSLIDISIVDLENESDWEDEPESDALSTSRTSPVPTRSNKLSNIRNMAARLRSIEGFTANIPKFSFKQNFVISLQHPRVSISSQKASTVAVRVPPYNHYLIFSTEITDNLTSLDIVQNHISFSLNFKTLRAHASDSNQLNSYVAFSNSLIPFFISIIDATLTRRSHRYKLDLETARELEGYRNSFRPNSDVKDFSDFIRLWNSICARNLSRSPPKVVRTFRTTDTFPVILINDIEKHLVDSANRESQTVPYVIDVRDVSHKDRELVKPWIEIVLKLILYISDLYIIEYHHLSLFIPGERQRIISNIPRESLNSNIQYLNSLVQYHNDIVLNRFPLDYAEDAILCSAYLKND